MKFIPLLLFISVLAASCKKVICDDCSFLQQNDGWQTENFKTNYTIQFPEGYTGTGKTGFEGNIFYKKRSDNSVILDYSYCSPLYCSDFGDDLPLPEPSEIQIMVGSKPVYLNKKLRFCSEGGAATGLFYYNDAAAANGLLYWVNDGKYKKALSVSYSATRHDEVVKILRGVRNYK